MSKTVGVVFFGDFFQDARCINMVDSILESGNNAWVIDAQPSKNTKYKKANLFHIDVPKNKKGFTKFFKFYKKSKSIIQNQFADVLIAGDLYSLPSIASHKKHSKLIYDSREIYSHLGGLSQKPLAQLFWSQLEKHFIQKANDVIVTAISDGEYLQHRHNILNTTTIFNYPTIQLKPPKPENNMRYQFGISEDKKILLYQGKLFEGRGLFQMIEIAKQNKKFVIVFVGDGNLKSSLKEYAETHKVKDRVHFTGAVPYHAMFELTQQADIGFSLIEPISKSYEHALPNKIFEYALCGVPTIASDLPEMKSVIEKYQLGKTVSHSNFNEQVNAVIELLNSNRNDEISQIALKHFTWNSQHKLFVKLLGFDEVS